MAIGRNVVVYTDAGSYTVAVGASFTIPYGSTTTVNIRQNGVDNLVLKSGASLFTILPNNVDNIFNIESLSRNLKIYNDNLTQVNLSVSNSTTVPLEIWKDGVLFQMIAVGQNGVYPVFVGSQIDLKSSTPYRIGSVNYNSNIGSGYSSIITAPVTLSVSKALFNVAVQNNNANSIQVIRPNQSDVTITSGNVGNYQMYYGDLLQIGSSSDFKVGTTDYYTPNKYQLSIVNNVTITVLNPTLLYVDNGYWNIGYTV